MARGKPLVLLVCLLLLLGLGAGAQTLSAAGAAPAPVSETHGGWKGTLQLRGGIDLRGETFVTAGEPNGASQTIVVHSTLDRELAPWINALGGYHYKVVINGKEREELRSKSYSLPTYLGKHNVLETYEFAFTGIVQGSMEVQLWLDQRGFPWQSFEAKRMASDGARLVSGSGLIYRSPGQNDIFEEGSKVSFEVRAGEGSWTVTMYDGTNKPVCGFSKEGVRTASWYSFWRNLSRTTDAGCKGEVKWTGPRNGRLEFTIPQGAFVPNGYNKWKVELRNHLISFGDDEVVVIDNLKFMPEPPKVTYSPAKPKAGETVTLALSSHENTLTRRPITHYEVNIWYGTHDVPPVGGSPNWVAQGVKVPASAVGSGQYAATYAFTVKDPDVLRYRIYAVDAGARMSGSTLTASSCSTLTNPDPNCNSRGEIRPEGSGRPVGPQLPAGTSSAALVGIFLAMGAIGAYVAWTYVPGSWKVRGGIAAVAVVVALVAAYWGAA